MPAGQAWRSCPLGDHNKWSVRGHRKPACRVPQQEGHILGVESDREGRVEAGR